MSTPPLPSRIVEILSELPKNPGVYEMQNENHETLYVGKAKNLKSRVNSYFLPSANHSARISKLIEKVENIEWTQTNSELEALILESNLIKQKNPKFNILLRDDKNFSYFKISMADDFPRITLARKIIKDGSKYFGPKTSSSSVRKTIDLLQSLFHFRSTNLEIHEIKPGTVDVKNSGNQKYPCLNYHLKKCDAPCIGKISKANYRKRIEQTIDFLRGNTKEIETQLKSEMMELVQEQKYELAAKKRDSLLSIESIAEKQIISAPNDFSADIIGIFTEYGHVFFHIFSVREGKIINSQTLSVDMKTKEIEDDMKQEALKQFLRSHPERTANPPKNIIINPEYFDETEQSQWEDFFEHHFSIKTKLHFPQKGKQKKLLEMAEENAQGYAKRHVASFLKNTEEKENILKKLQQLLHMDVLPFRMECYDISHYSGEKTVASMVVFEDGEAKNKDYRSFNIKNLEHRGIDDFASLQEAVSRRLKRLPKKYPSEWSYEKITRQQDFKKLCKNDSNMCRQISGIEIVSDENSEKKKNFEIEKKIICELYSIFSSEQKEEKEKNKKRKTIKTMNEIIFCVQRNLSAKKIDVKILFTGEKDTEEETQILEFGVNAILKKYNNVVLSFQTQNEHIIHFLEDKGFTKIKESMKKQWVKPNDSFANIPQLMIIDGGKGQLSSVAKVLEEDQYAHDITLCSLAKREEEVFLWQNGETVITNIQKNSSEGKLLQQIRDEAHRFAITKNRIGREKNAQKSVLDEIRGLGPKTKKIIKEQFGGVSGLRNATDEQLLAIISETVLKRVREKI